MNLGHGILHPVETALLLSKLGFALRRTCLKLPMRNLGKKKRRASIKAPRVLSRKSTLEYPLIPRLRSSTNLKTEDRRLKTKGRRQKTEDKRQKTKDRRQKVRNALLQNLQPLPHNRGTTLYPVTSLRKKRGCRAIRHI